MQLFLSQPGILSSIGDSLSQHVQTLLEGSDSPLTFSNKHFQENGLQGKYNTCLLYTSLLWFNFYNFWNDKK